MVDESTSEERMAKALLKDDLSARNLRKYGMRRGAYDGANRRRFVLFYPSRKHAAGVDDGNVWRAEFDTKAERDQVARVKLHVALAAFDDDEGVL